MKTYSMTLNKWSFYLEVWIHRGTVNSSDYYNYNGKRVERSQVPAKILNAFDSFSETIMDTDWDEEFGFLGFLSEAEPKEKVG